jgi:hypothetical protein
LLLNFNRVFAAQPDELADCDYRHQEDCHRDDDFKEREGAAQSPARVATRGRE